MISKHTPFEERYIPEPNSGCWLWIAGKSVGYGHLMLKGVHMWAHRVSYERHIGPIPPGLEIDHLCRMRACVNPAHLEPVTRGTNILRGLSPSAINARKTHCPKGHQYDAVYPQRGRLGRRCTTCSRERDAQRYRDARAKLRGGANGYNLP